MSPINMSPSSNGDHEPPADNYQTHVDTSHVEDALYAHGEGAAFVEHEKRYLDPSRWWFASTAFPLFAGTFGPMASAFSICALAENWRARLTHYPWDFNQAFQDQLPDPQWLIALNATSLAVAILANVFLLLNMIQRVPFSIAQPITCGGFFFASLFLLIMVGISGVPSWAGSPERLYVLTEAYYYACWAAGLYAMLSILMGFTIYGAYANHYSKDFQLSKSQRTLMVQTIIFMAYLLIGALIYSNLEGWGFLNSVYWADFTLLTVGIGDYYVPQTTVGRGLIIPFAMGGIVSLGLVVSSINSLVLEASSNKLAARDVERKREQVLKTINYEKGYYKIEWFRKRYFDNTSGQSELDRRKQEFYAMRDIIRHANSNRVWGRFAMSLSVFLILWVGGAGIFWAMEHAQDWTYFEALYFAYIILLTIGYGDFEARSNSGRPFFVFWSLLAVPALTVLIGDASDTVVVGISELTDYAFKLVTKPKKTLKRTATNIFTPSYLPKNFEPSSAEAATGFGGTTDVILLKLQDEDVANAEKAGQLQEEQLRDRRFYQFLLMREIRTLLVDCEESPPKKYTFEEWAYYLKLLGLDETNKEIHAPPAPPIVPVQKPDGSPELFNLAMDIDDDGIVQPWSWLGIRSPLMSGKTEPQWIVARLIIRLQRELHLESYNQNKIVPLSISTVRRETGTVAGQHLSSINGNGNGHKPSSNGASGG